MTFAIFRLVTLLKITIQNYLAKFCQFYHLRKYMALHTFDVLENCPIFKTSHPLVHLRPKFLHPFDLGRPISNETSIPPLSPNYSQSIKRKHDPRMTVICYQVLPSGWLSFSVSTHLSCLAFLQLLLI